MGALACAGVAALSAALTRAVSPTAPREELLASMVIAACGTLLLLAGLHAWWNAESAGQRVVAAPPRSPAATDPALSVDQTPAARPSGRAEPTRSAQASVERRRLSGESAVRSASPMKDRATVPAEPAA